MRHAALRLALLPILFGAAPVAAQPAADGFLVATEACTATPAIRRDDNPGAVRLEIDRAYRLFAQNKVPPTHYLIGVPGASPERRWVGIGCGVRVERVDDMPVVEDGSSPAEPQPVAGGGGAGDVPVSTDNLLAISWQPAFCERMSDKAECKSQTEDRFDASNFALHGLWPQPNGTFYCGAVSDADRRADGSSQTWDEIGAPRISDETRAALEEVMPGTQSALDRHEWIKHGTCYGGDAEEYFAESLQLMAAINASPVRTLFAGRIGDTVTQDEIRAAFDAGFGAGAGERVRMSCSRDGERRLVGELTIGLEGEITPESDIGALIRAAPATDGGCDAGIVDGAGLQ
ncbi:MAG: ribonuclease T2 [Rhizobiaceae bacterium]|nr:ribonuclease T2 [Rhizobiaceae bacterium]